jgi:septal ring factor EnvC (AmiA/AmiB activator)
LQGQKDRDEQAGRIEQLKSEIAAERESREKVKKRIRDARKELTKVEHLVNLLEVNLEIEKR